MRKLLVSREFKPSSELSIELSVENWYKVARVKSSSQLRMKTRKEEEISICCDSKRTRFISIIVIVEGAGRSGAAATFGRGDERLVRDPASQLAAGPKHKIVVFELLVGPSPTIRLTLFARTRHPPSFTIAFGESVAIVISLRSIGRLLLTFIQWGVSLTEKRSAGAFGGRVIRTSKCGAGRRRECRLVIEREKKEKEKEKLFVFHSDKKIVLAYIRVHSRLPKKNR